MTNLEPKLFVFLLSTFLGLEVIRRVSPLLHTPLMSLTNAISAIAVVAAIQVISEAQHQFQHGSRHAGRDRGHDQYRGRLLDHRSHAKNVPPGDEQAVTDIACIHLALFAAETAGDSGRCADRASTWARTSSRPRCLFSRSSG